MLSAFSRLELFFLVCALVGGGVVLIKLVLQFFGGDDLGDTGDGADAGTAHADSDIGFRWLSLHGLAAFFMMFGWVGFVLHRQDQWGGLISIAGAVAAGMGSVWVIGRVFAGAARLQSSGTLKTDDAVGSSGTVYLAIPAGACGRVTINFRHHLREFDAMERSGTALPTGTPVRVVKVNANILVVEAMQP